MLGDDGADVEPDGKRRLVVTARKQGSGADLEFVSAAEGENLEDQLAHLAEPADVPDGREISFRLLRHYASSVRHQKYHERGHCNGACGEPPVGCHVAA